MNKLARLWCCFVTTVCASSCGPHAYAGDSLAARIAAYDWAAFDQTTKEQLPVSAPSKGSEDFTGLKQDTRYFLAYQVAAIAVLYVMPEGVSGWSQESKDSYSFKQWEENVTHPHWDKDDYFINYVLHPYWGAGYYTRARQRGYDKVKSIWYSALLSTLYEYGVEALFERPSIQDLVVTPLGALLMGEYFYTTHTKIKDSHLAGRPVTRADRWKLVLTDPLGAANDKVKQLFGDDAQLSVRPFVNAHGAGRVTTPVRKANDHPRYIDTVRHNGRAGIRVELKF